MHLPFTVDQFFSVFAAYNLALWPAQAVLLGLAFAAVAMVFFPRRGSGMAISAILAILWAWVALAYHLAFFSTINPLAYLFAGASLIGAVVFAWQGIVRRRLEFKWRFDVRSVVATGLVVFALILYPAWTWQQGHRYPAFPTFGLPCPTTLFTMGMLTFLVPPHPRSPLVVPVLWCAVGMQAAFLFGVQADLALVFAGVVGVWLIVHARVRADDIAAPGTKE